MTPASNTPSRQPTCAVGPREIELQGQAFCRDAIHVGDRIWIELPDGDAYWAEVCLVEMDWDTGGVSWTARGVGEP